MLKICLSISVLLPGIIDLIESRRYYNLIEIGLLILFFYTPIVGVIFLTTKKTAIWIVFLGLITAVGGYIGYGLWIRNGPPYDVLAELVFTSVPAILFWSIALQVKHTATRRNNRKNRGITNG